MYFRPSRFLEESIKTRVQAIASARAVQEARLLIDAKEADKLLALELYCWDLSGKLKSRGAPVTKPKKPAAKKRKRA